MASAFTECFIVSFILTLPILYESSKMFRYYFKFFLYYGIIMITSVVVIPIMMWRPRDVKNLILASFLCCHISRLLGLHWELQGKEHLEKDQACVIVANHQSSLDILGKHTEWNMTESDSVIFHPIWIFISLILMSGMFEIWPVMQKCTVVAKKELLYAWPFGLAAWLCGLIFIDRLNSETAKDAINHSIDKLKQDKVKLWIFPEGTRKNTGEIHSFKKGAFHTAINAQLPILPVVFTQFYFLHKSEKRFNPGQVVITVLPPIETEGLTSSDLPELMNKTRNIMVDVFNDTSKTLKDKLLL